jgi:hypothetical protein
MSADPLIWLAIAGAVLAIALAAAALWLRRRQSVQAPLPAEWSLMARPVFNTEERRVYRQLREALPHHIVLSKLPLVRFCQPADPQEVRYWYELLGATHVGFAICSANGRVLAAIDIDSERAGSRRTLQIKQKVLAACRVRYLRCPVDHLPSIPELQLLVPHQMAAARGPQAATPSVPAPSAGVSPRRQPRALWQDSGFFQDSFFGSDSRLDGGSSTEFGALVRGLSPLDPLPPDGPQAEPPPVRH